MKDFQTGQGDHRCGYIAIVGRPNVGKSTLMNALIGANISITSRKAQTTRHRIAGIYTTPQTQFIFIDTPGFQTRHANLLNRSLNRTVTSVLSQVDAVLLVIEAQRWKPEDQQVLDLIPPQIPVILVLNKIEQVKDQQALMAWVRTFTQEQPPNRFVALVPISATRKFQLPILLDEIRKLLPLNPPVFDKEEMTDRSERFLAAEIVREKLFRLVGDELPYTSTVVVEKFEQENNLYRIFATILVERDAHKAMLIGAKGERLKRLSTDARLNMENLFGKRVYLELFIKVKSGWADNQASLRAYGYE